MTVVPSSAGLRAGGPAITARALGKRFGNKSVLDGLDLSIPEGAVYGLLGRNGAGKTTLLMLAMGLLIPSAGEVQVLGKSLVDGTQADKAKVGYVGERSILPPWMRIDDLLNFEARLHPGLKTGRLREGIDGNRKLKTLSKGELRRLDLEIALAPNPRVLILDEPFDGPDPVARAESMEALASFTGSPGRAVLMSSHVLPDLERLCDRIGVLSGGRIAFESELDSLKEGACLVATTRGRPERLPIELETIGARSDERGSTWLVRGLDADQEAQLRRDGFQVLRPGLDELGIELLRCLDTVVPP